MEAIELATMVNCLPSQVQYQNPSKNAGHRGTHFSPSVGEAETRRALSLKQKIKAGGLRNNSWGLHLASACMSTHMYLYIHEQIHISHTH